MKTTRELYKEFAHQDRTEALQELLEKNYDAEAGYRKAMQSVENEVLIEFLRERAAERCRFANELDQEIRKLNETPKDSGSTAATLHRKWMDVKLLFRSSDDEAVMEECITGEKAILKEYQETLYEQSFAPETEILLKNQLKGISEALEEVEGLEEMLEMRRRFPEV